MNGIILCAGFATRMYPLTKNFPKPLLKVGGKPVLDYLIDQLREIPELENVYIISNAKFIDHFRSWHQEKSSAGEPGFSIEIINDETTGNNNRLGAVGDLMLGLKQAGGGSPLLVSGGDNIYQFSLKPLYEAFQSGNEHCIVTLEETDPNRLQKTGVLELSDDERVIRLHEKPDNPLSTWTSPPLYFLKPDVISQLESFLKTPGNHDALGYFIDYLAGQKTVRAIKAGGIRLDIGSMESYRAADELLST